MIEGSRWLSGFTVVCIEVLLDWERIFRSRTPVLHFGQQRRRGACNVFGIVEQPIPQFARKGLGSDIIKYSRPGKLAQAQPNGPIGKPSDLRNLSAIANAVMIEESEYLKCALWRRAGRHFGQGTSS